MGTPTRPATGEWHLAGLVRALLKLQVIDWAIPVLAGAALVRLLVRHADLRLDRFTDRTIGVTVLKLVDVQRRTTLVFWASAAFLITVVALLLAGAVLARASRRYGGRGSLAVLLLPAQAVAAVALGFAALLPADPTNQYRVNLLLALAGTALAASLCAAFPRVAGRQRRLSPSLLVAAPLASWSLAFFLLVERAHGGGLTRAPILAGAGCSLLALLVVPRLAALGGRTWTRRVTNALVPIAAAPLIGPVAQELGFSTLLRFGRAPTFAFLHAALLCALLLAAVAILMLPLPSRWRARLRVGRAHLPLAVLAFACALYWRPAGTPARLDFFHHGESLLPAQQLVRFGRLPYLDILPTHGLVTSYLGGLLQWALDGAVSVDGYFLGEMLISAVGVLLLYLLLRRGTGSALLAALLVGVLPQTVDASMQPYAWCFAGVLAVAAAMRQETTRAFLLVAAALLMTFASRIDAGMVALASALVPLGVYVAVPGIAGRRVALRRAAASILPVAAVVALVAVAISASEGGPEKLRVVREFLSIGFQGASMGLPDLFSPAVPRPPSQLFHFVLPALSLIGGGMLVLRTSLERAEGRRWSSADVVAFSLPALNLLVLTRAFGRHTEAELGAPVAYVTGFSVITLLLLAHRLGARKPGAFAASAAVLLTVQAVGLAPMTGVAAEALVRWPAAPLERPVRQGPISPRHPLAPEQVAAVESLRASLPMSGRETFLDLSQSPYLYIALDRPFPGYVIPMLYTVSELTQRQLIARAERAEIIGALLESDQWWHSVDGVADSTRSYRVHEWALDRFPIARRVGPYKVLLPASSKGTGLALTAQELSQFDEVALLPWLWARRDPFGALTAAPTLVDLLPGAKAVTGAPGARVTLAPGALLHLTPSALTTDRARYLRIDASLPATAPPGSLAVRYSSIRSPAVEGGAGFSLQPGSHPYLVPLSSQYAWHDGELGRLDLQNRSSAPVEVEVLQLKGRD